MYEMNHQYLKVLEPLISYDHILYETNENPKQSRSSHLKFDANTEPIIDDVKDLHLRVRYVVL